MSRSSKIQDGGFKTAEERGKNMFHLVCDADDTEACIEMLGPWAWLDLYNYLETHYSANGISGQILGLVILAGVKNYAASMKGGGA